MNEGELFKQLSDGSFAPAFVRLSDGSYAPLRADVADCSCGPVDPGDPAKCYLVCARCDEGDPTRLYLFEPEAVFAAGFNYSIGKVIGLSNGVCLIIQGYYYHPGGEIPDFFATMPGLPPSVVAMYDDCLESPCGLTDGVCGCVLPERCVQIRQGIPTSLWWSVYGDDQWCAAGVVVVASQNDYWRRRYTVEDQSQFGNQSGVLHEEKQSVASSYTVFRMVGTGVYRAIQHQASFYFRGLRTDTRPNGEQPIDREESATETLATIDPFEASVASGFISGYPFGVTTPAEQYFVPPGVSPQFTDITGNGVSGAWGPSAIANTGAVYREENEDITPCTRGGVRYRTYEYAWATHDATIAPRFGGASFTYAGNYINDDENYIGSCFGGDFADIVRRDRRYIRKSHKFSAFWLRDVSDIPDFGPGCPLIVQAFRCGLPGDPVVSIFVDIKDFLPMPAAVTVLYEGEPTRFFLEPVLVDPGDEQVYTPLYAHESCVSGTGEPPPDNPYRVCVRCPTGQLPGYPSQCRVSVNIPEGTAVEIRTAAIGQPDCEAVIRYVATDQTTDDATLPPGVAVGGAPCSATDGVECGPADPPGPNIQPGGTGTGEGPTPIGRGDPGVQRTIDRMLGGCRGCGDPGVGGF